MKFIKSNIELIVVLLITLLIFVTLVVFYEEKLNEKTYCPVENNELKFTFIEQIKDGYIRIKINKKIYVINIFEDLVSELETDKEYKITLNKKFNKCDIADIQDYLNDNQIEIIEKK